MEEEKDKVEEPITGYLEKKITFFSSIEDSNKSDNQYYASLTPEQCLNIVYQIRISLYPFLKTDINPFGKKIYFC
jgi:hypothetical protein